MIGKKRKILGKDGKRHAVAYARVWEDDLEKDPEAQFKLIREWASKNDIVIDKEFSERSDGTELSTPVKDEMARYISCNMGITKLLVVEIGRLCRNYGEYHRMCDLLTDDEVSIISISKPMINAGMALFLLDMDVLQAELEYRCYKEHGAKTILGQITFDQYVKTMDEHMNQRV